MDALLQNLRFAFRTLRKSPGFTAVVVLTLALGIGANSAIFSAVNALLLRPLPYPDPDRLVTIYHYYPSLDGLEAPVSAYGFQRYRDETHSFSHMAVSAGWGADLMLDGEPQRLQGRRVSAQFFDVFGGRPVLGRFPQPEEDAPGRERLVVLSHGLWQRAFGGDPEVIGEVLVMNGEPHEVIGVMPAGFRDFWDREVEIWRPLALTAEQLSVGDNVDWLLLSGRLRPGVTPEAAGSELEEVAERLKGEALVGYPTNWSLHLRTLDQVAKGELRTPLLVLLGAVGFVLLIACANVANLLLARSIERSKEVAVRVALGAQRGDLLRQLLTESMLLSLVGGALGLLFARWSMAGLTGLIGDRLPVGVDLGINLPVLLFTLILSLGTGILFGLLPSLQVTRPDLQGMLREGGRTPTGNRLGRIGRQALVVGEVALALTLLTGAGLLVRSFARLQAVDPGFRPEKLLTFSVILPQSEYDTGEKLVAFFDEAVQRIEALPGVEAVGVTTALPFGGGWDTGSFSVEGHQPAENEPGPWGDIRLISPGFHRTLAVELVRGRLLSKQDRADAPPVVVVDEEMVRRYWPNEDPVGKRITFDGTAGDSIRWITVAGVVAHTKHSGLEEENRVQLYFPLAQRPARGGADIAVRTVGDPLGMLPTVRRAIQAIDSDQPLSRVRTMEAMMEESLGQRRLSMFLLTLFSGLAALLSALGIYGVISHLVSQRTRELGVRLALGAGAGNVVGLVLRQGMGLALGGVALGLLGAFALTRFVASQLFGVEATDPVAFAATALLISLVALLATVLPAARAARLDPLTVLRGE
jgi:putative ABC transport system permease protein